MSIINIDPEQLKKAIKDSGYPFELRIAKNLKDLGFSIQPSYRFFDISRDKETEIDLAATKRDIIETKSGKKIVVHLRIGIECKDNSFPYVCFGLNHEDKIEPGIHDCDSFYCHVLTSRDDGIPNKFAIPIFDPSLPEINVKQQHHQFSEEVWFYTVTAIEEKRKNKQSYFKLHIPDTLNHALAKLGMFIEKFHDLGLTTLKGNSRYIEGITGYPLISICFLALVHSGSHYRYKLGDSEPKEAFHTPVFLSKSYGEKSINYIVDFIKEDTFEEGIIKINKSFNLMIRKIVPYILAT